VRYCKPIDIHRALPEIRALLQPGQHITASGARGVWVGRTKYGTDVAMWHDSVAKRPGAYREKFAILRRYATALND
jgi:hypothetical protein